MEKNLSILKCLLLLGSIYFFSIAIAHMFSLKIPGLFVYFNVPSYSYQDKIISFLAFGWAISLFVGFLNPVTNKGIVKSFIVAGIGAIIGLSIINLSVDFSYLAKNIDKNIFWAETIILAMYLFTLTIFYFLAVSKNKK